MPAYSSAAGRPSSSSSGVSRLATLLLLLMSSLVGLSAAHMIELGPSTKECFFEDLNPGDQMTLTYQVGGGGNLDVDTWVSDPNGHKLFDLKHSDTGTYSLTALLAGRYTYCFSNEFSTVSDKTVSFNVHGIIYVPDDGEMLPIEREIRDLAAGLQSAKDEQEYLVIRERVHRNTVESTNARVKWWSILQIVILFTIVGVQIIFIRRQFDTKGSIRNF